MRKSDTKDCQSEADFNFLLICMIVLLAFAAGIFCGETIGGRAAKRLYAGAMHESPMEVGR